MSDEADSEAILRRSLDAIDGLRRRLLWTGYVAVAATILAFIWLDHVARTSESLRSLMMAAVLAITCVIAWSTYALAIFITRMTRRILRAIDLARG
jgi:IS1 family transposase